MAAAAKKRRPEEEEAAGAEEEMHLAFRGAANALSQVYGQAVAAQEKSFRAGERRAMVRPWPPPARSPPHRSVAESPEELRSWGLESWGPV